MAALIPVEGEVVPFGIEGARNEAVSKQFGGRAWECNLDRNKNEWYTLKDPGAAVFNPRANRGYRERGGLGVLWGAVVYVSVKEVLTWPR